MCARPTDAGELRTVRGLVVCERCRAGLPHAGLGCVLTPVGPLPGWAACFPGVLDGLVGLVFVGLIFALRAYSPRLLIAVLVVSAGGFLNAHHRSLLQLQREVVQISRVVDILALHLATLAPLPQQVSAAARRDGRR